MKIRLLFFTFFLFTVALLRIDKSYSYFNELEKVRATLSSADCFENCEGSILTGESTADTDLIFYINSSDTEVGFVLDNVNNYDFFEYKVTYDHITEFGKLTEVINGAVDNSTHKDTIIEEEIILGTETAGGTRVYHSDIEEIKLEVFLENSGIIERTLSKTLYL